MNDKALPQRLYLLRDESPNALLPWMAFSNVSSRATIGNIARALSKEDEGLRYAVVLPVWDHAPEIDASISRTDAGEPSGAQVVSVAIDKDILLADISRHPEYGHVWLLLNLTPQELRRLSSGDCYCWIPYQRPSGWSSFAAKYDTMELMSAAEQAARMAEEQRQAAERSAKEAPLRTELPQRLYLLRNESANALLPWGAFSNASSKTIIDGVEWALAEDEVLRSFEDDEVVIPAVVLPVWDHVPEIDMGVAGDEARDPSGPRADVVAIGKDEVLAHIRMHPEWGRVWLFLNLTPEELHRLSLGDCYRRIPYTPPWGWCRFVNKYDTIEMMSTSERVAYTAEMQRHAAERLAKEEAAEHAEAERKSLRAREKCPPPAECPKCGEDEWLLLSFSPNEKSAVYQCANYFQCGKKVTIRADLVAAQRENKGRAPISKEVQREVWRRDGGRCVECGSKENLEFDHIIPVSEGGANTARNLQVLCEACNRKKRDNPPGSY